MSKIKGQNFRLLKDGSVFPEATNCSITLQGNTEDTSTKDTEGMFNQEDVVSNQWSAQVDTIQSETAQLRAIISMFVAAQPVGIGWDQTSGSGNATPQEAPFARQGQALLNDFVMNFNDRETVNTSISFQGTGGLETV
jgi:hypothetical protein